MITIEKFKQDNADFLNSEYRENGWLPYTKLGASTAKLARKMKFLGEQGMKKEDDLKATLLKALNVHTGTPSPLLEPDKYENADWCKKYDRALLKYQNDSATVFGQIVRKVFHSTYNTTEVGITATINPDNPEVAPFREALKYTIEAIKNCYNAACLPRSRPAYFDIWNFTVYMLYGDNTPQPFKMLNGDEWVDILSVRAIKKDGAVRYLVDVGCPSGPLEIIPGNHWCNYMYKQWVSSICIPSATPLMKAKNVLEAHFTHLENLNHDLQICPILHSIMGVYHIWECMDISRNESGYVDEIDEPSVEVVSPEVVETVEEPKVEVNPTNYIAAIEQFKDYVRKTVALHKLEGAKYDELPAPLKDLLNMNAVADLLLAGANLELPDNMKAAMEALEIPIV